METLLEEVKNSVVEINDGDAIEIKSYWTCDVCDGDSDSGCQMSDPQNCVRR